MAPPTGSRAGHRGRSAPRASRGAGVGKHRAAHRTDQDGDIAMDRATAATRSARGNRGVRGGRSARPSSRLTQNVIHYVSESDGTSRNSKVHLEKTTLKISGLKDSKAANNPDGGLRSLLDFLERKSSKERPITLGRGVIQGQHVFVKVSRDDAPHVLRLNGFTYAGAPLTIEVANDPMPGPGAPSTNDSDGKAAETKQKLIAVLASRYDAQQRLLNLAALGSDPTLISMGSFATTSLAEKSFKALLHLTNTQYKNAAEKEAAIQAVSLASNDIVDVGAVFTLARTLPRLRRLDLSGNKLEDLSKISKWRHEFPYLEELHLVGNPVVELPNHRAQIIDWFPSLQILNGERVRTLGEATENLKAFIPTPLPKLPSNIRDGSNNVAATFLHGFFSLYDHDRRSLAAQFYDNESVFSINTGAGSVDSESYNKYSRDIAKLGVRNPRTQQRLITGVNLISELWVLLPPTRHPGLDQPEQWLVDSHTFPNLLDPSGQSSAIGLTINVVSQFEELDPGQQPAGIRKFARSFVLGPSKLGATHPYRVVSDELTLKDWTPHQANVAMPVPVAQVPAAPIAAAPPVTAAPRLLDEATQTLMVQELSKQTGMNAEYSRLCLSGPADWNFDLALKSFHEKRAELPPEAFVMSA
ncbi:uncharacterized protein B0T15DRAFT_386339 [Chaetomium strumarium]|uniref:mRNA export factor MEX67 n=1 Tax=Chaetomium strumarium TaxID=1170767 RepID=A0AAJ0M6A0_9PEZI|nr:hypothetical protein B0T15DRAFT_386339 [Chaetomium strumarium]